MVYMYHSLIIHLSVDGHLGSHEPRTSRTVLLCPGYDKQSSHLFLISSASVRSILFQSLLCPSLHEMFLWYL